MCTKFSDDLVRHLTVCLTSKQAAKELEDFVINKTYI